MPNLRNRPITERLVANATRIEALGNHYIFEPLGISSAVIKIMHVIEELDNPTPTEIMRYVGGSKSNVSQRLAGLEKKGYINRSYATEAKDKRKVRISLSNEGRHFLKLAKENVTQKSICLEECFEADEIINWHSFMDKLEIIIKEWESCFNKDCPFK